MMLLTGFVLQGAGFLPNQEQTMTVQVSMVTLYGLFPLVCYLIGAAHVSRFKLDEKEHAKIRQVLDQRAAASRAPGAPRPPCVLGSDD